MPRKPIMRTRQFLAGLETEHVVGLSGVGVSVINFTLSCNTVQTMSQVLSNPPHTAGVPTTVVLHGLGAAPTAFFVQVAPVGSVINGLPSIVSIQHITADNTAIYVYAQHFTSAPNGISARAVVIA